MARLPWFQFYPADWFRDTRCLSLEARGAWIDILGVLWDAKIRGKKSLDLDGWASELGKPVHEFETVLQELDKRSICTIVRKSNGEITLMSRRQVKDEKARQQTNKRVGKYRLKHRNGVCNGVVTVEKSESEVRSQNQKKKEKMKSVGVRRQALLNFSFTEAHQEWAKQEFMVVIPDDVFIEFKNYWLDLPEKKLRTDWENTFKNRIRLLVTKGMLRSKTLSQIVPPQIKCAYANAPCEAYAVPSSTYCQVHRDTIQQVQTRRMVSV